MSEAQVKTHSDFILPPSVVRRADITRLVREFEQIDGDLITTAIRKSVGSDQPLELQLSTQLADFLTQNQLKPRNLHERSVLIKELRLLNDTAPVVHMTFAVEADEESLQQLVQWLRESVHPQVVVTVGLQPGLVAGVYLRTPNHVHDLSLRAKLKEHRHVLVKELGALRASS